MAKKKKPVKTSTPDRHTTPRVVFHVPDDLLALIEQEADANDRTRTAEIIRALKSYYRSLGMWPLKAQDPDAD